VRFRARARAAVAVLPSVRPTIPRTPDRRVVLWAPVLENDPSQGPRASTDT